jgi:hypothetical protein
MMAAPTARPDLEKRPRVGEAAPVGVARMPVGVTLAPAGVALDSEGPQGPVERPAVRAAPGPAGSRRTHSRQQLTRSDVQYSRRLATRSPSNSRMATSRIRLRQPWTTSSNRASHSAMAVVPSR